MNRLQPRLLRLLPLLAILLAVGCTNPYLKGFTGDAAVPLGKDAPVQVIGANRDDAEQMRRFEAAKAQADREQVLLGTSTIVSASSLRDEVAAEAGRELGATHVLYSFAYVTSTVETDRRTDHHTYDYDNHRSHGRSYSTTSTTRHWFEYRAYFFRSNH
ncbi:MAG: hypothetical protein ACIAXF_12895 [Phycisphaerales bacterium JB063]